MEKDKIMLHNHDFHVNHHMHINIVKLKIIAHIGVNNWEKLHNRELYIDLNISLEKIPLKLEQSVNYDELSRTIIHNVASIEFDLIEDLAVYVHKTIIALNNVLHCIVVVHKPRAIWECSNISCQYEGI